MTVDETEVQTVRTHHERFKGGAIVAAKHRRAVAERYLRVAHVV